MKGRDLFPHKYVQDCFDTGRENLKKRKLGVYVFAAIQGATGKEPLSPYHFFFNHWE